MLSAVVCDNHEFIITYFKPTKIAKKIVKLVFFSYTIYMKKRLRGLKKHIAKRKKEVIILASLMLVVGILWAGAAGRDKLVAPLLARTGSDTLVKIIYFDRLGDPNLHFALGNYYFGESGHYDLVKAESYYKKALRLDSKLALANYQLSRVYFVSGDQQKALQYINYELEYYPEFKRSHYIRGLVYGYSGQLPLAVKDFKAFIDWKPDSWAGHNDLAWVYFQQGDFNNAYLTAQEGLKYSPNNPWLLNSIGISAKNLGNRDEAKQAFEQALSAAKGLTAEEWGRAYPGNDPDFYQKGYGNMRATIENNLKLLDNF